MIELILRKYGAELKHLSHFLIKMVRELLN